MGATQACVQALVVMSGCCLTVESKSILTSPLLLCPHSVVTEWAVAEHRFDISLVSSSAK